MEVLKTLEKKVADLIALVKDLKTQNNELLNENKKLSARLKDVEQGAFKGEESLKKLNQQKVDAQAVVDDLISSIDALVSK